MGIRNIETRLRSYESNGKEVEGLPEAKNELSVLSHWNIKRHVVLQFQGKTITVDAADLTRAIDNAANW